MAYQKLTPILATGTTEPRYLGDRFADVVNVKDFGAKGDGETDDSLAIQAAIDAGAGKNVFFPTGVYIIADNLVIEQSGITLIGEGKYSSVIKRKAGLAADVGGVTIKNCSDVSIKSLGFDGDRFNQTTRCVGVNFSSPNGGVTNIFVSDIAVERWGKASDNAGAENFSAGMSAYFATNVVVMNSFFGENGHYGLTFYGCVDVLVKSCISKRNVTHGYGCANTRRMNFVGNTASNNTADGIWFRNLKDSLIQGNTIEVACQSDLEQPQVLSYNGIILGGRDEEDGQMYNVNVSNNVIYCDRINAFENANFRGIVVQSETSVRITNVSVANNIVTNFNDGIRVINVNGGLYSGNEIRDAHVCGFYADGLNSGEVSNNLIYNCKQKGMYLSCRFAKVTNNTIITEALDATDTYYGIHVDGRNNNNVFRNTVQCGGNIVSMTDANKFKYAVYLSNTLYNGNKIIDNVYLCYPYVACLGYESGYSLSPGTNLVEHNWSSSASNASEFYTIDNGKLSFKNPNKSGNSGLSIIANDTQQNDYKHGLYSNERNKWMIYSVASEDGVFLQSSPSLDDSSNRIPTTWWVLQKIAAATS